MLHEEIPNPYQDRKLLDEQDIIDLMDDFLRAVPTADLGKFYSLINAWSVHRSKTA